MCDDPDANPMQSEHASFVSQNLFFQVLAIREQGKYFILPETHQKLGVRLGVLTNDSLNLSQQGYVTIRDQRRLFQMWNKVKEKKKSCLWLQVSVQLDWIYFSLKINWMVGICSALIIHNTCIIYSHSFCTQAALSTMWWLCIFMNTHTHRLSLRAERWACTVIVQYISAVRPYFKCWAPAVSCLLLFAVLCCTAGSFHRLSFYIVHVQIFG